MDDLAGAEALHHIDLRTALPGIQGRADDGGLDPESGPPARLLLQTAAALIVAVFVGKEALPEFSDGPLQVIITKSGSFNHRLIHEVIAGLELGADRLAVFLNEGKHAVAVSVQGNALVRPGRPPLSHHGHTEIPLGPVQLAAVKLIGPGKLPLAFRQETGFVSRYFKLFHNRSPQCFFDSFIIASFDIPSIWSCRKAKRLTPLHTASTMILYKITEVESLWI